MADASTPTNRPLVVVANRLPVSQDEDGSWLPSAGGLVTAMRPVMEEVGGAWIGWDGGVTGVPQRVEGLNVDLHPVGLTRAQVQGFYYGFSNRTIWPLFHDLIRTPVIERRWWRSYQEVNRRFAEHAAGLDTGGDTAPLFWIQDYHLMLAPELIRGLHPASPIGFFLHIPFPPPELFARLPWRREILHGLLAADALGFHTERYCDNFRRSCARILDLELDGADILLPDGRRVLTGAHPISIDADEFTTLSTDEETERELAELREQFAGRHVFLGVDRLDYTKGIRHRLQAIELLLERNPRLRERFAFVQIAVPSRDDVKEYRDLRTDVETEVGRINGRFTEPGHDVPVHYLYRSISKSQLAAYYRLADVMCVTPLKDGMNLVSKEFVTCQDAGKGTGALLLSEFTGAALEFGADAIRCNPFDVEGLSYLMEACLELEEDDRRDRIRRMAASVRDNDVFRWVHEELSLVERGAAGRGLAVAAG